LSAGSHLSKYVSPVRFFCGRYNLPLKLFTENLSDDQVERLFHATRDTLKEWTQRLRDETGNGFPEKVTAFRDSMAVHGRYRKPCPECGTPVQRFRYAANETNYCPTCQTAGNLLADRALSRLLKKDWPRTLEELEARKHQLPGNVGSKILSGNPKII